jgi:hypothetical protein
MGDEKYIQNVSQKTLKGRETLADLHIYGRTILKVSLKILSHVSDYTQGLDL